MTLLTCVFRCDRIPYFIVAVFEDSSIEKSDVFLHFVFWRLLVKTAFILIENIVIYSYDRNKNNA